MVLEEDEGYATRGATVVGPQDMWAARARRAIAAINRDYDVASLCRKFPARLQDVVDGLGERLRK